MSRIRLYARNLAANWIGYGAYLALTLLTSWFVFHWLGDIRYGLWSLMLSLTGYLGIVDLGLRPAQYRYFNWYLGRGEPEKVNQVLCTNLGFFAAALVVLLFAGTVLGGLFGHIFPKTPPEYLDEVAVAVVLTAANMGLSAMGSTVGSLLETHERYDLNSALNTAVMAVRSAASILALYAGSGLIGLAAASVGSTLLSVVGGYLLSRRVFGAMRIRYAHMSRTMLVELLRFGIPCFFGGIGVRVIYYTSSILIAWLASMPDVGYYSLAIMLIDYGRNLSQKGASIFTPRIQQALARKDHAGVHYSVLLVTRLSMGAPVLVIVGIMVFGRDFLRLFYGETAAEAAGPLLSILGPAYLLACAGFPAEMVLVGAARVRLTATLMLTEATLNVGLTLLFLAVAGMGLPGVASGTAIPMALCTGVLMAVLGVRQLGMPLTEFVRRTATYWVPASALFWLACVGLRWILGLPSWGGLFLGVALACVAYLPIAWFLILPPEQREQLRCWMAGRGRRLEAAGADGAAEARPTAVAPTRAPDNGMNRQ